MRGAVAWRLALPDDISNRIGSIQPVATLQLRPWSGGWARRPSPSYRRYLPAGLHTHSRPQMGQNRLRDLPRFGAGASRRARPGRASSALSSERSTRSRPRRARQRFRSASRTPRTATPARSPGLLCPAGASRSKPGRRMGRTRPMQADPTTETRLPEPTTLRSGGGVSQPRSGGAHRRARSRPAARNLGKAQGGHTAWLERRRMGPVLPRPHPDVRVGQDKERIDPARSAERRRQRQAEAL